VGTAALIVAASLLVVTLLAFHPRGVLLLMTLAVPLALAVLVTLLAVLA
jgi:hypothetical protein